MIEPRLLHNILRTTGLSASVLGAGALGAGALGAALLQTVVTARPAAAGTTYTVTTLTNGVAGSLDQAIMQSELSPGADTIVFDPSLNGTVLVSSVYSITQDLTIDGDGRIILDGQNSTQLFAMPPYAQSVTLRGLVLTHASSTSGAIMSSTGTSLVVDHVNFIDNRIPTSYGVIGTAIMVNGGNLTLTDSSVSGGEAGGNAPGGAVTVVSGCNVTIARTTINNNTSYQGAGLVLFADDVSLDDVAIGYNLATTPTSTIGGVVITASTASVQHANIYANNGIELIIGIENTIASAVTISDTMIAGHNAIDDTSAAIGLGLSGDSIDAIIDRVTITGTTTAAFVSSGCDGDITIASSTISGNTGAGVAVNTTDSSCPGQVFLDHDTIAHNALGIGTYVTGTQPAIALNHTVVADNDVDLDADVSADWSLIQNPGTHLSASVSTLIGIDPHLFPLTIATDLHGVCTFDTTSALFNAGDPGFAPPPALDEISQPRVAFDRIDIGAWELQTDPTPTTTAGDDPVAPSFTG